jgi:hypothetical protein
MGADSPTASSSSTATHLRSQRDAVAAARAVGAVEDGSAAGGGDEGGRTLGRLSPTGKDPPPCPPGSEATPAMGGVGIKRSETAPTKGDGLAGRAAMMP